MSAAGRRALVGASVAAIAAAWLGPVVLRNVAPQLAVDAYMARAGGTADVWCMTTGSYHGPWPRRTDKDPWGNPWLELSPSRERWIVSTGPDGWPGATDDAEAGGGDDLIPARQVGALPVLLAWLREALLIVGVALGWLAFTVRRGRSWHRLGDLVIAGGAAVLAARAERTAELVFSAVEVRPVLHLSVALGLSAGGPLFFALAALGRKARSVD